MDALSTLLALPENEKKVKGIAHTPVEIQQQPKTWRNTFHVLHGMHAELLQFLTDSGIFHAASREAPTVFLIGAGTSDYIGRALSRLLRQHWQCEVVAVPSTELLTNMQDFLLQKKHYVWISFSRSGDSSEGVAVLEQALEQYPDRIRHLIVTCNEKGAMVQRFSGHPDVMHIILDHDVNDRGLAMTSSFTNMVIAGQYLAYIQSPQQYATTLDGLILMAETLVPIAADTAYSLAKTGFHKVCFLGTGALQAAADESALKVTELSAGKVYAITQSALGLRHGPLSSLDAATLIVAYISGNEDRARYEIDLLQEIKDKRVGCAIVAVTSGRAGQLHRVADHVIAMNSPRSLPDACRPPVDVIVGQLLGLFTSMQHGILPDTPSPGGVINRVVSHVKIYSPVVENK